VQKKHEYESLKCELNDSKLGYMLQSSHSTLKNLVTKDSIFYTINEKFKSRIFSVPIVHVIN